MSWLVILGYSIIPVILSGVGAVATAWRRPGDSVQSIIQHFAAGVVFAAAAGELLPDMLRNGAAVPAVVAGGLAGVALMLVIRTGAGRVPGPAAFITVTGIDVLIDGLIVSLGFKTGVGQGLLLTVALSTELLLLGLSVAIALGEAGAGKVRVVLLTTAVALLLPAGAVIGTFLFRGMTESWLTGFFALGLVALLYLVTEELLVEAHERSHSPFGTTMFFVGFFALILLDEAIR